MTIDAKQIEAGKKILLQLKTSPEFKRKLPDYESTMRMLRTAFTKLPDYGGWKLDATDDTDFESLLSLLKWFGPLTPLIQTSGISSIMINAPDRRVLVEQTGKVKETNIVMTTDWIRFVARSFRQSRGLSVNIPDRYTGSLTDPPIRYTYVSSRLGVSGDSMYIRVLPRNPLTWGDLVGSGMMNKELAVFLQALVKIRVNILVSGGSGAGKTTLLTTMGTAIPRDERVIAVEDEHEIHLNEVLPNFTAYELNAEVDNITMSDLLRHVGLKVAPDRIFVGEIRGKEAFDLMQAMNTGVDGSMTTIHANSAADGLKKFADYALMSGVNAPPEVIYHRIADGKPVVVQVTRLPSGQRIVSGIAECRNVSQTTFEVGQLYGMADGKPVAVRTSTPFSDYLAQRFASYNISLR